MSKIVKVVRKLGSHLNPSKWFLSCGHVVQLKSRHWQGERQVDCVQCKVIRDSVAERRLVVATHATQGRTLSGSPD